ncbi:uncharacterized protein LOC124132181 isoform X1 [Haliotis rufescens]|uniref:uncharacterized protein LOC124132181 isoform X1 n=1 Tax=Haliotis rufescens TaxID=6454 RepID=UPI00201F3A80|nr:uncharacterized protein LOC124132181 isoform X1 [Haliotis rufescens]
MMHRSCAALSNVIRTNTVRAVKCSQCQISVSCASLSSMTRTPCYYGVHCSPQSVLSQPISYQKKSYCSKDFDFKNDPELKSFLDEIRTDFKREKKSQANSDKPTEHTEPISQNEDDNKDTPSLTDDLKYDSMQPEIEDVEQFERQEIEPPWVSPIGLKRGVSGVFEVDELVTLLEKENARDIVVINIPPEARFGDQMVIVSAVSHRHLRSMSSRIKWVHKQRKGAKDLPLRVEGYETTSDWHAMDLGNIIVHIFMPETREHYDLETLWTNWGEPGQVQPEEDPYTIDPEEEFWQSLEPPSRPESMESKEWK